jgi:hypothetical protein
VASRAGGQVRLWGQTRAISSRLRSNYLRPQDHPVIPVWVADPTGGDRAGLALTGLALTGLALGTNLQRGMRLGQQPQLQHVIVV